MGDLEAESIRAAMDQAWRDHHHARDQTWHALQIEAAFAAGMLASDAKVDASALTLAAATLTLAATVFGILISLHHREVEVRKFTHILNCEEALGLHKADLISGVSLPSPIRFVDAFLFWKTNTALFILRMHVAVAAFVVLYAVLRYPGPASYMLLGGAGALLVAALVASGIRQRHSPKFHGAVY